MPSYPSSPHIAFQIVPELGDEGTVNFQFDGCYSSFRNGYPSVLTFCPECGNLWAILKVYRINPYTEQVESMKYEANGELCKDCGGGELTFPDFISYLLPHTKFSKSFVKYTIEAALKAAGETSKPEGTQE